MWSGYGNFDPGQIQGADRLLIFLGDVLVLGTILYLWKLHPLVARRLATGVFVEGGESSVENIRSDLAWGG